MITELINHNNYYFEKKIIVLNSEFSPHVVQSTCSSVHM